MVRVFIFKMNLIILYRERKIFFNYLCNNRFFFVFFNDFCSVCSCWLVCVFFFFILVRVFCRLLVFVMDLFFFCLVFFIFWVKFCKVDCIVLGLILLDSFIDLLGDIFFFGDIVLEFMVFFKVFFGECE